MAILLDETTRAEYLAQSVASTRAALVVSALSGTVVVEVYDGFNVLRASGTMASPWAAVSGSTITIGEVNATGITVTSGGSPTADWYCQFRSGTRFVRGTFGVFGSGRDFTWSLANFETGSRGTIGSATLEATGTANPVLLTTPAITGTAQVGQTLTLSTGSWSSSTALLYARQWRRDGVDIAGQTAATYQLGSADLGATIGGYVVASNASGSTLANATNVGPVVAAGDPSGLPLLYEANVTGPGRYLGSFRFPLDPGFPNPNNWSGTIGYGAPVTTMWHRPNAGLGTLIVGGRAIPYQAVSEITIPATLSTTGATATLPRAAFAVGNASQRFFDLANGNQGAVAPADGNDKIAGGVFIYNGNLYLNTGSFYQGITQTVATHFKRTGTALDGGTVTGPFAFAAAPYGFTVPSVNANSTWPVFYRSVACTVPPEWQAQIGGPMILGQAQYSNNKPLGNGPYMAVFDPDHIGVINPVPNEILCSFDDDESFTAVTKWIRSASITSGIAFPDGSGTVLVLTMLGQGTPEYGDPIELGGTIYDPAVQAKGWHAWPYARAMMAFRAQDLADARNGLRAKDSVLPYATWPIEMPGGAAIGAEPQDAGRSAMAYDRVNRRLYIIERETNRSFFDPIVHVYQLSY